MEHIVAEMIPTITAPPIVPNDKILYQKFLEWKGEEGWFKWVDSEVNKMSNPSLKHPQLSRFYTSKWLC